MFMYWNERISACEFLTFLSNGPGRTESLRIGLAQHGPFGLTKCSARPAGGAWPMQGSIYYL